MRNNALCDVGVCNTWGQWIARLVLWLHTRLSLDFSHHEAWTARLYWGHCPLSVRSEALSADVERAIGHHPQCFSDWALTHSRDTELSLAALSQKLYTSWFQGVLSSKPGPLAEGTKTPLKSATLECQRILIPVLLVALLFPYTEFSGKLTGDQNAELQPHGMHDFIDICFFTKACRPHLPPTQLWIGQGLAGPPLLLALG